jgi:ribosomal small subunit protein bTHX
MGRGDKKTAKGKRFMGSFGVSRPHKTASTAPKAPAAKATTAKAPAAKATKAKA